MIALITREQDRKGAQLFAIQSQCNSPHMDLIGIADEATSTDGLSVGHILSK
jgi:hypothetical protein